MRTLPEEALETFLRAHGFQGWGSRHEGRRLRCPHGLLIGLAEECPVGCVSPLVVAGLLELVDVTEAPGAGSLT
ncbi:MAG: hypothetical protein ACLFWM_08600 [Actinomycetota bacterium]